MFTEPMDLNTFTTIVVLSCTFIAAVAIMRADPTMPYLIVVLCAVMVGLPFAALFHIIAGAL